MVRAYVSEGWSGGQGVGREGGREGGGGGVRVRGWGGREVRT